MRVKAGLATYSLFPLFFNSANVPAVLPPASDLLPKRSVVRLLGCNKVLQINASDCQRYLGVPNQTESKLFEIGA